MITYKLVPVEPTEEMLAEGATVVLEGISRTTAGWIYGAMLAAAPEVQVEVVGWQFYQDGKWWNGNERIKDHRKNTEEAGIPVRDVYAAPQPTEQKSTACVGCEGAPVSGNSPCAVCGQKSALDVSALVGALESLLEMQDEDCRYDHQGYCQNHNLDHVDDGCRVARAKTALAAYRNQGGDV